MVPARSVTATATSTGTGAETQTPAKSVTKRGILVRPERFERPTLRFVV